MFNSGWTPPGAEGDAVPKMLTSLLLPETATVTAGAETKVVEPVGTPLQPVQVAPPLVDLLK